MKSGMRTDVDRWWVITNITNLCSQRHFPGLDYTISFHFGLMMRMAIRPKGARGMTLHPSTMCLDAANKPSIGSIPPSNPTTKLSACS